MPADPTPRIAVLDIETTPNLVWTWDLFNVTIPINHIVEPQQVLCFAIKWLDEDRTEFYRDADMLGDLYNWLDAADAVITYNGKKFDLPHVNREFIRLGWTPPSPYKHIDLYPIIKREFDFPSYKLAYVLKALGLAEKEDAGGFETWLGCMSNDPDAWELMEKYNRGDVTKLEPLYHLVKPWIKSHPNIAAYTGETVCPVCGSGNLHRRGTQVTVTCTYQRYACNDCGHWSRAVKRSDHVGIRSIS